MQAARAASCADEHVHGSPTATASPTSTSTSCSRFHRAHGQHRDGDRGAAAGALRRPRSSTATCVSRVHREAADRRGLDQRRLPRLRAGASSTTSTATTTSLEADALERLARGAAAGGLPARRLLAVHGHAARQAPARSAVGVRARRRGRCGDDGGVLARPADARHRRAPASSAAGWCGGWSTPGADVVCLVRDWVPQSRARPQRAARPACSVVRGDVRDQALLERVLGEYEIDTVFHLAAQTIVGDRQPQPGLDVRDEHRGHLGAARGLPAQPDGASRSSSPRPTRPTAISDAAAVRRGRRRSQGRHPVRRQQVVRRPDRADLRRRPTTCRSSITRCGNFYGGGDLNWNRIVPGRSARCSAASGRSSAPTAVRPRLLLRRGRRGGLHAAGRGAGRATRSCAARRSTSRTRRRSRCSSSSSASCELMDIDARARRPQRGDATRSAHQYLSAAKARDACSAGSRCSRSTRACGGRSPGTASFLGAAVMHDAAVALPLLRRAPTSIRCCRSGDTPLANALLDARPARRARADASRSTSCFCPACSLVQITETVPPEELFRDYVYFSSFSDTMLRHAEALAERLVARARPRRRQPRRRGRQQRRLPAPVLPRARACPCSASSRRATSPRVARGARHPDASREFFGADAGRAAGRRGARAPT